MCLQSALKMGIRTCLSQPAQMTTFEFFQAKKWRKFKGSRAFPQKENKISSALLKYIYIYIPSLIQAKHTLTCKRRKGKSLQEIANGFQAFPLFIFTDSGFLLGKRMSFLNVPDLGLPSYKHLFREVLCCYLFSTNNWSRSIPEAWWPQALLLPAVFLLSLANSKLPQNLYFGLAGVKAEKKMCNSHIFYFGPL